MVSRQMSDTERLEYCKGVVKSQEESGLTIAAWCKENKMSRNTFHRYKRMARDEGRRVEGGVVPGDKAPGKDGVEGSASVEGRFEVEAGYVTLRIGPTTDPKVLVGVFRALGMSC